MRNPVCRCFIIWLYWPLQLASEDAETVCLDPFTDI